MDQKKRTSPMKKRYRIILLSNLLIVLLVFNLSVVDKENIRSKGRLIFFELAPVDPRSLMQGDYMRLAYHVPLLAEHKTNDNEGLGIFLLDSNQIVQGLVSSSYSTVLGQDQILIRFKKNNAHEYTFGSNSYFFEEGKAKLYEKAKYGGLRVNSEGYSVLIGLFDSRLNKI